MGIFISLQMFTVFVIPVLVQRDSALNADLGVKLGSSADSSKIHLQNARLAKHLSQTEGDGDSIDILIIYGV
jgi:hypothetical protein